MEADIGWVGFELMVGLALVWVLLCCWFCFDWLLAGFESVMGFASIGCWLGFALVMGFASIASMGFASVLAMVVRWWLVLVQWWVCGSVVAGVSVVVVGGSMVS